MREALYTSDIKVWNFNEMLTNDIVSFEQPGPENLTKVYTTAAKKVIPLFCFC